MQRGESMNTDTHESLLELIDQIIEVLSDYEDRYIVPLELAVQLREVVQIIPEE